MSFLRDLVKAGSVGFVETAAEHVGLLFYAKKTSAQRFINVARANNRHLLNLPSGLYVEFQGAPEDAQDWFVGSADIKNAFHQMRIAACLQSFFHGPLFLIRRIILFLLHFQLILSSFCLP